MGSREIGFEWIYRLVRLGSDLVVEIGRIVEIMFRESREARFGHHFFSDLGIEAERTETGATGLRERG